MKERRIEGKSAKLTIAERSISIYFMVVQYFTFAAIQYTVGSRS